MNNMQVGASYADFFDFFEVVNGALQDEDITGDDFTLVVKDSTGATISTLTTGVLLTDGLEIEGTNRLNYLIGTGVTGTAGIYTYTLFLNDPSNGSNFPVTVGKIKVV